MAARRWTPRLRPAGRCLIGSEGMLAVTTEVTVSSSQTQLALHHGQLDDVRKAGDAVAAVIAAASSPAGDDGQAHDRRRGRL